MTQFFVLATAFWAASAVAFAGGYKAYFPQAARGLAGDRLETSITFFNPQPQALQIELRSLGIDLPLRALELEPLETSTLLLEGDELQVGWVELSAPARVSASARIVTRSAQEPHPILSQVTILAREAGSQAVLPVFRGLEEAEDTGFALAALQPGRLRFTLLRDTGETEAVASIAVPEDPGQAHFARFVDEIFEDVSQEFRRGSLIVEHFLPQGTPAAIAAAALYTRTDDLQAAPVRILDGPLRFSLSLGPDGSIEELAQQYGFFVSGPRDGQDDSYFVVMDAETARSIGRDPRVRGILDASRSVRSLVFDFNPLEQGWEAGFADYPADDDPDRFDFVSRRDALPPHLGGEPGFRLEAENASDDVFMYLKRRIEGLEPNRRYRAEFRVEFATQANRDVPGVGGAPGESVVLKAGVASIEPQRVLDDQNWYRLNVDKGQQFSPGRNALVLGNIAKTSSVFSDRFALKTLSSDDSSLEVESDGSGAVWLLVGTDSGFEGRTRVLYNRISVTLFVQ